MQNFGKGFIREQDLLLEFGLVVIRDLWSAFDLRGIARLRQKTEIVGILCLMPHLAVKRMSERGNSSCNVLDERLRDEPQPETYLFRPFLDMILKISVPLYFYSNNLKSLPESLTKIVNNFGKDFFMSSRIW